MAKILIVDDDKGLLEVMQAYLKQVHHSVECFTTAEEAMQAVEVRSFDIVVLDWMLPGMSGVEFCKWFRRSRSQPVIMLTGKAAIANREEGLDSGADDYLTKPFAMAELAARVRALLRRPSSLQMALSVGPYTLDPSKLTVIHDGPSIRLPPREFALLEFLVRHPDKIYSPDMLMNHVWPSDSETTVPSLRTSVKQVRKMLSDENIIETIGGAGYKLGYSQPAKLD